MPQICHEHCPKGSGGPLALLVVIIVACVAVARPVARALAGFLEVVALVIGVIAGLAGIAGGIAVAVWMRRQDARERRAVDRDARVRTAAVRVAERRAIEAPKRDLSGLPGHQVPYSSDRSTGPSSTH